MYIWTENHKILNLDHYTQVAVHPDAPNTLAAFDDSALDPSTMTQGTIIAKFDNELDAKYANCLLFKAIMAHAGAWDATAVYSLSQEWENVKEFFSDHNEKLITDLLTHSEISVTGLDEVTISYSKECDQKLKDSLRHSQQEVEGEMDLGVDIKWVATEDIPWKH